MAAIAAGADAQKWYGRPPFSLTFFGVFTGALLAAAVLLPPNLLIWWLGLGEGLAAATQAQDGFGDVTGGYRGFAGAVNVLYWAGVMAVVLWFVTWRLERVTGIRPRPLRTAVITSICGVTTGVLMLPTGGMHALVTPLGLIVAPLFLGLPAIFAAFLLGLFGYGEGGPSRRGLTVFCGVVAAGGLIVPAAFAFTHPLHVDTAAVYGGPDPFAPVGDGTGEQRFRSIPPGLRLVPLTLTNDGPGTIAITDIEVPHGDAPMLAYLGARLPPAGEVSWEEDALKPFRRSRIAGHGERSFMLAFGVLCLGQPGSTTSVSSVRIRYRARGGSRLLEHRLERPVTLTCKR